MTQGTAPSGCFTEETFVYLVNNKYPKSVAEVSTGDVIIAHPTSGTTSIKWKPESAKYYDSPMIRITTEDGKSITVTTGQLFPCRDNQRLLQRAQDIKSGVTHLLTDSNTWVKVNSVETIVPHPLPKLYGFVSDTQLVVLNGLVLSIYSTSCPPVSAFWESDKTLTTFHNLVINVFLKLPATVQRSLSKAEQKAIPGKTSKDNILKSIKKHVLSKSQKEKTLVETQLP